MNYILYREALSNLIYTVEIHTQTNLFCWWYVIKSLKMVMINHSPFHPLKFGLCPTHKKHFTKFKCDQLYLIHKLNFHIPKSEKKMRGWQKENISLCFRSVKAGAPGQLRP